MTLLTDSSRLGTPVGAAGVATKAIPGARAFPPAVAPAIPAEVEFILSALQAGQFSGASRREGRRWAYRAPAALRLFSDLPQTPPWTLYARNVAVKALGFVTRHRLPLGYGGILTLADPQGQAVSIDCTVLRCREAVSGWFEGSVYFNREQPQFAGGGGTLTEL
jgi:hypothetical protein